LIIAQGEVVEAITIEVTQALQAAAIVPARGRAVDPEHPGGADIG
jgi:hypothetical protein